MMKTKFTDCWRCLPGVVLLAAAMAFAGCKSGADDNTPQTGQSGDENKNEEETGAQAPVLSIDHTSISVTAAAGACAIAVTSNATWTAAVDYGATWCEVSPPGTGTENGTVTVNVAENATGEHRAATLAFSAGTVGQTATVTQYGTPRYAASSATWVFGAQTWSDAIQIPGCDKDDFGCSPSDPRCRSHTDQDGLKRYYYNWPYVNRHADTLCPSPWRVPSEADFETLIEAIDYDYETLVRGWDWYGGYANCNRMDNVKGMANYWSSEGAGYVAVELLIVFNKDIFTQNSSSPYGDLVRCVR